MGKHMARQARGLREKGIEDGSQGIDTAQEQPEKEAGSHYPGQEQPLLDDGKRRENEEIEQVWE